MKNKPSLEPKTSVKISVKKIIIYTIIGGSILSILISLGVFLFGTIGVPKEVKAATTVYFSILDGSWTTAKTWNIGAPAHNPTATNNSISIETNMKLAGVLDVTSNTTLTVMAGDTLMVDGNVIFRNGSLVTVEAAAVLWVTGDVQSNNNSDEITIDGTIIINGDFNGGNGSEINGTGSMDVDGDVSTAGSGSVFGSTDDCSGPGCSSSAGAPLPVSLVSFEAHLNNDHVQLNWLTATEINNDFFTIEKSKDGKTWEVVSTVDGAGNSNQLIDYFDTDYSPFDGSSYYRLKQTDFDGKFEYFPPKAVNHNTEGEGFEILSASPNPFFDEFNLRFNTTSNSNIEVVITDLSGAQVYSNQVSVNEGNNEYSFRNGSQLSSGTYLVNLIQGDQKESIKIIKK